jgi:hypothetical protein
LVIACLDRRGNCSRASKTLPAPADLAGETAAARVVGALDQLDLVAIDTFK